jgi:hypothetical protein
VVFRPRRNRHEWKGSSGYCREKKGMSNFLKPHGKSAHGTRKRKFYLKKSQRRVLVCAVVIATAAAAVPALTYLGDSITPAFGEMIRW